MLIEEASIKEDESVFWASLVEGIEPFNWPSILSHLSLEKVLRVARAVLYCSNETWLEGSFFTYSHIKLSVLSIRAEKFS